MIRYGPDSDGLHSHGPYSYGLYSYGTDLPRALPRCFMAHTVMAYVVVAHVVMAYIAMVQTFPKHGRDTRLCDDITEPCCTQVPV